LKKQGLYMTAKQKQEKAAAEARKKAKMDAGLIAADEPEEA
jgi:hypothetical protein